MLSNTALGYLLKARPGTEDQEGRKPGCLATDKLNTSIDCSVEPGPLGDLSSPSILLVMGFRPPTFHIVGSELLILL